MLPADRVAAACATAAAFADRSGAERVVLLLDAGDDAPVMVERLEDGGLEVTEEGRTRALATDPAVAPLPLPQLRPIPPTAIAADPETGELEAPLGSVQRLADSALELARAFGGRTVAIATFPTRDAELPLTVAARAGEPVVLELGGRHFSLPIER